MPEPARPSRQDLVVPPRGARLPVTLGAIACGCLGFGLVWALGIGRTNPTAVPHLETSAGAMTSDPSRSEVDQPLSDVREPGRFPGADGAMPVGDSRWLPRTSSPDDRRAERVNPASFEPARPTLEPVDLPNTRAVIQAGGDHRPLSRFSVAAATAETTPADPADAADGSATDAAADGVAPTAPPGAAVSAENGVATELTPPSDIQPQPEAADTSTIAADPPATDATNAAQVADDPPAAESPAAPAEPNPSTTDEPRSSGDATTDASAAPPTAAAPSALDQLPTGPAPLGEPPIDQPPAAAPSLPPPATQPPSDLPPPPDFSAASPRLDSAIPPPVVPPAAAPAASGPPREPDRYAAPPPQARPFPAPPAGPLPFAAAPPLVPQQTPPRGPDGDQSAVGQLQRQSADDGGSGQGRPGPMQLEGVQSPQLTVEKRGPREIQVGKPARYEILVRNVGSATAQDVLLRDSVPYGTTLVATTPPAAPAPSGPGADTGDLVWLLGTLAPGGQARVVVELLPQAEGEIGSVASVTFRADASVRSRATKPALSLACAAPKPVLIGHDAGLTITVTNPGTGVATGVVLEGFLPENVSHRSGRELEFDVGQLRPGESRTIDLVLGTRGPGVHTARLAARADGGLEVQQAVNLEVTAPTLELEVDMPLRRFLQRPATCAISMVNAGTATARSIELAAQLPPGMKFVRANNSGWHDERTHRVLWNLEELPPGETGTVEVVVMPVDLGPQKILAAARSADGLADQVTHVCDVEGLAALFFEVTDSEDPIEVQGLTEYVVRVGNQGTKAASGVRLSATLLGDLEPVGAQGPAGHRVENLSIVFEPLAKLAPSEEAVFKIRVRGRTAGDQRVQVQLMSEDNPAPITKEEVTRVYADR